MKDIIITLCGSTRFKPLFEIADRQLTYAGYLVFNVGSCYRHFETPEIQREILEHEEKICRVHKRKILLSRAILVIDGDGQALSQNYMGDHTKSEIRFATRNHIPIYYYSKGGLYRLLNGERLKLLKRIASQ